MSHARVLGAQWSTVSSGVGPSNSGTGNLGDIPSGTKVLLGFNEPNHGARLKSGPAGRAAGCPDQVAHRVLLGSNAEPSHGAPLLTALLAVCAASQAYVKGVSLTGHACGGAPDHRR